MSKKIKEERIKHLLRNLISRELLNFQHNNLITLSRVELSSDLSNAIFYITVFGKGEEEVILNLNEKKGYFRKQIAKKLNLRYTPSLRFIKEEDFPLENREESIDEQRSKRDSKKAQK